MRSGIGASLRHPEPLVHEQGGGEWAKPRSHGFRVGLAHREARHEADQDPSRRKM